MRWCGPILLHNPYCTCSSRCLQLYGTSKRASAHASLLVSFGTMTCSSSNARGRGSGNGFKRTSNVGTWLRTRLESPMSHRPPRTCQTPKISSLAWGGRPRILRGCIRTTPTIYRGWTTRVSTRDTSDEGRCLHLPWVHFLGRRPVHASLVHLYHDQGAGMPVLSHIPQLPSGSTVSSQPRPPSRSVRMLWPVLQA